MTETGSAPGRRRYRRRGEADELAAEFEASGLMQREFCARRGVALNTLGRYLKRFRVEVLSLNRLFGDTGEGSRSECLLRDIWGEISLIRVGDTGEWVGVGLDNVL